MGHTRHGYRGDLDVQGDYELTLVTADDRLLRGKGFRTLANR